MNCSSQGANTHSGQSPALLLLPTSLPLLLLSVWLLVTLDQLTQLPNLHFSVSLHRGWL